jgi:hypothetical protein
MNRSSLCYGEKRLWKQNPRWPHFTTSCWQTKTVSFLLLDCIHLCGNARVENLGATLDYPVDLAMGVLMDDARSSGQEFRGTGWKSRLKR